MTYSKDYNKNGRGLFGPGNDGGNGRKPGTKLPSTEVREAITSHGTPERVAAAMDKLYEIGMRGSVTALESYLDRVDGKPTQRVEMTGEQSANIALHLPRFGTDNELPTGENGTENPVQSLQSGENDDNAQPITDTENEKRGNGAENKLF